jgi:uncharacterized membrane protein YphA (DoxX/SURF4 family)
MRKLTTLIRVIVGLLFMFSGFVKFNDPVGFSYKMEEYFEVFSEDLNVQQDSLNIKVKDARGNELTSQFPVFSGFEKATLKVLIEPEQELMEIGDESFNVTIASVYAGSELVFEEMYTVKDLSSTNDTLYIHWALGNDPENLYKIDVKHNKVLNETVTLDFSENLKPQPLFSRFFEWLIPYSMWIGLFVCIFELVLGYALLIGWKPIPTTFTMLLMIIFFTFLTGYSAIYDKVTDCGCFGDAIKLTPWESFWKDIVLSALIIFLFIRSPKIKAFFSPGFALQSVIYVSILSFGYSLYAITYLPPVNFLNFANGNNIYERTLIPEGKPKTDSMAFVYYYKNIATGNTEAFSVENAPVGQKGWEFVDRDEKVIRKAYKPSLDNFNNIMHPELGDVSDSILHSKDYQLIVVSQDLAKAKDKDLDKLVRLINEWTSETGKAVWFLTGSTPSVKEEFNAKFEISVPLLTADKTFIKSIVRSNPGIVLLKGPVVIKNYPSKRIPSFKKIKKKLK